jgi:hypothetical protein
MPFQLPANFNPGDQYNNLNVNAVAAAINTLVNGTQTAFVATQETTTSTTYADLTTVTDTVTATVGQSGLVWVMLSAVLINSVQANTTYVGVALSGANTVAASDNYAGLAQGYVGQITSTVWFPMTGLAPGATTFKMKYRVSAGTGYAGVRRIAVIPFP